MKIGVLTSSRADFGIYSPLLDVISKDASFTVEIIAFGTHLSEVHGMTINEIESKNFGTIHKIGTLTEDTSSHDIARAYANVVKEFADFWNENSFDLILCLGDRYEMSASIQAGIPYNIPFAHFHGGEETLGAIDNIYRHQITLASKYHFTSTDAYKTRVEELLGGQSQNIFYVGSLSLSNLSKLEKVGLSELSERFGIPNKPYILSTFHPETVNLKDNEKYIQEMLDAFDAIPETHHIVVTMPNADTNGSLYRKALEVYGDSNPNRITLVESFGKDYYFSALKHAAIVIGNSSSAIIEAASFGQYVINIGKRQEGRLQSANTFNCAFNSVEIVYLINSILSNKEKYTGKNIYVRNNTIDLVIGVLRKIANGEL